MMFFVQYYPVAVQCMVHIYNGTEPSIGKGVDIGYIYWLEYYN